MKKNDETEITITDLTEEGFGIGHTSEGYALFVKGALPGDRVIAHVTKVLKRYSYAIVSEFLERSADRVQPLCTACGRCGGCTLQELSYGTQLEYKRKRVLDSLERTGGFKGVQVPIPIHCAPVRYRNKAEIPVGVGKDGEITAGYYAIHSHRIIPCDDCILSPEEVNRIRDEVLIFMRENGISVGQMRHIVIRHSDVTGETLLCLVMKGRRPGKIAEMHLDGVDTLCVNYNNSDTNVIFGSRTEVIYGPGYITERIGKLRYRVYASSFFQVNTRVTEKLYDTVKGYVSGLKSPKVWDLYCGAGTIGLYVAEIASVVAGIEVSPVSVVSAEENARDNGITNVTFIQGRAEERAEELIEITGKPDVIILDPPRKGCDPRLLDTIMSVFPTTIIYVSCNPATLARDLKILSPAYEIKDLRLFDMFPNTGHVETVVQLSKGDIDRGNSERSDAVKAGDFGMISGYSKGNKASETTNVKIDFSLENLDMSELGGKATYEQIKDYVREQTGFRVSTLYISQVKRKCGLEVGESYNKPKSEDAKQPQCTPEKEAAIMQALRHYGVI